MRRPWHKLAKTVKALDENPSDEELHEVRIRTKRVRYAAEAVSPVVGKPAKEFAKAAAQVQDVLGDLHDAVVAERWLSEWAQTWRPFDAAQGAAALASFECAEAERMRESWEAYWIELSAPDLRAWM